MALMIKQIPEDFLVEEIPSVKCGREGGYSYFILEKKNCNTLKAVKLVAEKLRIGTGRIGWAGNKDKNAITRQLISIQNLAKEEAEHAALEGISIKYCGRGRERIYIGNLAGNKFTITVRNLDELQCKAVEDNSRLIEQNGFILPNYFDEQRFGGSNIEIGKALLKQDFAAAAREIYRKEVSNPIKELRKVHTSNLSFYIHAYQSLLFNETLAKYVKKNCAESSELEYRYGLFAFPKKKINNVEIPIIGFGNELVDDDAGMIASAILEQHGMKQRDFIIRSLPGLSVEGTARKALMEVKNLRIGAFESDELNSGKKKCMISFTLDKGCYATVVVKALSL